MKVTKVLKIEERGGIELCRKCGGKGWTLSELEFGDIPGDDVRRKCNQCNGTGRVVKATIVAEAMIPYDSEMPDG